MTELVDVPGVDAKDQMILVRTEVGSISEIPISQIEISHEFNFISRLQFLHETDLRHYNSWAIDEIRTMEGDIFISRYIAELTEAKVAKDISLRYVSDEIGHGVFAEADLSPGTYIGEYVGIVHSMSTPNAYSLTYPSADGGFQIDASEYGNIIRFLNHSADPNCEFLHIWLENIAHVVCISSRLVSSGEQLTVDYGPSYWKESNRNAVEML